MNLLAAALGSAVTWTRTTGFFVMGASLADAWHFHVFGVGTDLVFFTGAAAAMGVHLAMQATVGAAKTPPAGG